MDLKISDRTDMRILNWQEGYGLTDGTPTPAQATVEVKKPDPYAARGIPQPPELYEGHHYTLKQKFFGRKRELAMLDRWAASTDSTMMVEAIGGQGKSVLTWHWFTNRAAEQIPGFAGGMWWSFYESDSAMDNFITLALAYLTREPMEKLRAKHRPQRERELLHVLRTNPNRHVLFVMDGLERILNQYYTMDAPMLRDDRIDAKLKFMVMGRNPRACTNPVDGLFLQALVQCPGVKILMSTRLKIADLETRGGTLMRGVQHHLLHGLAGDDAVALMAEFGVTGTPNKIKDFTAKFGNHGLLLTILAGRVGRSHRYRGDFDRWVEAEGDDFRLRDVDLRQRQTQVLDYALRELPDDHLRLLRRIAVFRFPVTYEVLAALNPYYNAQDLVVTGDPPGFDRERYEQLQAEYKKHDSAYWDTPSGSDEEAEAIRERDRVQTELEAFEPYLEQAAQAKEKAERDSRRNAETQLEQALTALEDRGLLLWDGENDLYDLHPVVRGYAYEDLTGDEKQTALKAKQNFFESREGINRDDVKSVDDLRREFEIFHAMSAAGALEAAFAFYRNYLASILLYDLGAYQERIEILREFFPEGDFSQLPDLSSKRDQSYVINAVILSAGLSNQFPLEQMHQLTAQKMRLNLADDNWNEIATSLENFAIFAQETNLYLAIRSVEVVNRLSALGENNNQRFGYYMLMEYSAQCGLWDQAERAYEDAYKYAGSDNPEIEFRNAYMQFYRGENPEAAIEKAKDYNIYEFKARLFNLRAEWALRQGNGVEAERHVSTELDMRRNSRMDTTQALGTLARTYLLQGRADDARRVVEDGADDISAAEVWLQLGEQEKALERANAGYAYAWNVGEPYVMLWELNRAKAVLDALGAPYPAMPPFNPNDPKHKFPLEDEIMAGIEEMEREKAEEDARKAAEAESSTGADDE